jgi:hypothetical protein
MIQLIVDAVYVVMQIVSMVTVMIIAISEAWKAIREALGWGE